MKGKLFAAASITAAIVALGGTSAQASATPHVPAPAGSVFSPEQAGYQVSHAGRAYRFVTDTFTLPDAGNFGANVGSFGLSVQGWGPSATVVLGISTCATTDCQTGSPIVHNEPWNAAIAVYDTTTHALITANGASPAMAAGDSVTEAMFYNSASGDVVVRVTDNTSLAVFSAVYHAGLSQAFKAVRLGFETSAVSPWGPPAFTYNAPATTTPVEDFGQIVVTNLSGHHGNLISTKYGTAAPVTWTRNGGPDGAVNASSSAPSLDGTSFGVSLQP
jgi:hypothetical protein